MCQFFSFVSDGKGNFMYSDWEARKQYLSGDRTGSADSHTSIAHYAGYEGSAEDLLNKYEYNPLTKHFQIDQINALNDENDEKAARNFCNALDFSAIVPALRIKPIVNPLDLNRKRATKKDIVLLKKWASVRASVRASVGDSVYAYVGNFFVLSDWTYIKHEKGLYPLQPVVDLWEAGLVASFDGKLWRLHGGKDAKILWSGAFQQSNRKSRED